MRAGKLRKVRLVAQLFCMLALVLTASSIVWSQTTPFPKPVLPPSPAIVPASQTVPAGFDETGFIGYASVDAMCSPAPPPAPLDNRPTAVPTPTPTPAAPKPDGCKTSGGWIQVNNNVVRVPQNAVVIFPNTTMTWEEIFENNPGTPGVAPLRGETGLALTDRVRLPGTYEAHVQGNIVNGTYIAGLIFIAQLNDNLFRGFIESIEYVNGVSTATFIVNGRRIVINDPVFQMQDLQGNLYNKGRYTIGQSVGGVMPNGNPVWSDVRFAVDQNNPTVRSETGYPMCLPRQDPNVVDDPQCPQANRPRDTAGNLLGIFTMNKPGASTGFLLQGPPQDPLTEAPLEVGDYVSVIGTLELDAQGQPFISANSVIANLGIFTFPGSDPAYTAIDVIIQGTGGIPAPAFPEEAARVARVEGFSTDPTRNLDISAIDVDVCGTLNFRLPAWVANFPVENGPPNFGKKGRFRFTPNGGTFLPPPQSAGIRVSGGIQLPNNNGIISDSYQAPNKTFIFPENLASGNAPPTSNFGDFAFLVNGSGPWPLPNTVYDSNQILLGRLGLGKPRAEVPIQQANQFIGQLNPFPDAVAPLAQTCNSSTVPNQNAANAIAGFSPQPPSTITAGTKVTLTSSGSSPANGPFAWVQIVNPGDPLVSITSPGNASATFMAPVVSSPLNLSFQLTVGGGNTTAPSTATVSVPIIPPPPGTPPSVALVATINGAPTTVANSGATVTLTASGVDPTGGALKFTITSADGIALTQGAADGSVVTLTAPTVAAGTTPQTFSFTATATGANGLSSSTTITLTVNPAADTIKIGSIVYRTTLARLEVTVFDFTPNVSLTATLDIINPATQLPYSGLMGPTICAAPCAAPNGVFALVFTNIPPPNSVTITSSAGGVVTAAVTRLR